MLACAPTCRSSASAIRCSRCRLRWPARCSPARHVPITLDRRRLDSGRDGRGAQRGDGVQPPGRRADRRAQPAHRESRAAARRDDARARRSRSSSSRRRVFVFAAWRLNPICFALSPVALAIVFWYSLAKRYTTWTQLFLGWRWRSRRSAAGWRSAAAAAGSRGCWRGDRHLGRRLRRPVRLPGSRVRSRARPAVDSGAVRRAGVAGDLPRDARRRGRRVSLALGVGDAAAGVLLRRRRRRWPLLLVYEQSLVRADDLSQVKRAFDLNGYVGILYLLVLAVSLVWPLAALKAASIAVAITGASGAIYATRTLAALLARGVHVELVVSDYGRRLLRDELGDAASVDRSDAVPDREVRARRRRRIADGPQQPRSRRDDRERQPRLQRHGDRAVLDEDAGRRRARPVAQPDRARRRRDAEGAAAASSSCRARRR